MHFSGSTAATAILALLPAYSLAQTFTDCDATKESCKPELGLPSSTFISDFTTGESSGASWNEADGTSLTYGSDGAEYTIARAGQAPTIESAFTIFYGKVEVVMKAAHGTGIVSSIVLESSVLDEIDWEFIGGVPNQVQTNYYGLANTTTYDRVGYHDIANSQNDFHAYTIDWSPERIEFLVDGNSIRTIPRASTQGRNYPQTPMHVKLGNWAAGGPGMPEGTVKWAGGETNFDDGPFNMVVRSIKITNYNPACSYVYSDRSGSDDSIDVITSGDSCVSGEVANPNPKPSIGNDGPSESSTSSRVVSSTGSSATSSTASSAASSVVSTASETATEAPTLSQTVANIVPTAYINTNAVASTTFGTSTAAPSSGLNSTTTGSTAMPSYTGGAALNSVVTGMSLLAVAAGFWAV